MFICPARFTPAGAKEIEAGVKAAGLPVMLSAPVTDHAASDDCGVAILGAEPDKFWHDRKGADMNAIRTRTLIEKADIVVVRFGGKIQAVECSL